MSREDENVVEAKNSLKSHIKFFESLLKHINSDDVVMKGRAMWAAWCLHRYMQESLINDIENAMKEHGNND